MTHIIIPRSSPIKSYGIKLIILLSIVLLIWGAFELGRSSLLENNFSGSVKKIVSEQQKQPVKMINKELLALDKKYRIQQEACQIIKETMEQDQQKIMALEKELAFYKGIMAPAKGKESIYLQSLEIVPYFNSKEDEEKDPDDKKGKSKEKFYKYKFIVAQKVKKRTQTKGTVSIDIRGKQGDKEVKLSMSSLVYAKDKPKKSFTFAFKYFKEFEGIISLPDDMKPQAVDILIETTKKKSAVKLNNLSWSYSDNEEHEEHREYGELKYVGQ